jgi:hypothetical protein
MLDEGSGLVRLEASSFCLAFLSPSTRTRTIILLVMSSSQPLPLEIFTTLRLQPPSPPNLDLDLSPVHIPLFPLHLERLLTTYQAFSSNTFQSPQIAWWEKQVLQQVQTFWQSRLADAENRTEMRVRFRCSLFLQ